MNVFCYCISVSFVPRAFVSMMTSTLVRSESLRESETAREGQRERGRGEGGRERERMRTRERESERQRESARARERDGILKLLKNVFSNYRMCSRTRERPCPNLILRSLTIECVLLL